MNFIWAITSRFIVSLIFLIGIFSLLFKKKSLDSILLILIGFSAGGLAGGAFLHILPESLEHCPDVTAVLLYVIYGFIIFFFLERYLYWRHCHDANCNVHPFTYLNLIGGSIHNFSDGLIIGATFFAGVNLGIVATLAIIFHEIPREIGDFGVLLYGGFSRSKALFYNFITALTSVAGTLIGYILADKVKGFSCVILPIAAGGFIYIAACDLIPEIHKQTDMRKSNLSMVAFLAGIFLMYLAKSVHHH